MNYGGFFDFEAKQTRLVELTRLLEDPAIWKDIERTQEIGREKKLLEHTVETLSTVGQQLEDAQLLFQMARDEVDESALVSIAEDVCDIEKRVADLEFRRMFSDPMDPSSCFLDVQSGSGGTEAQDWAAMLERMYLRYCERKGFTVEVLEESPGDVAGIKSATIKVTGEYAYGYLRTETGVHRLVRKSPFDSGNRRHTSLSEAGG